MEELKVPFHCIITGPTNCGKTKYFIEQLRGPFKNLFDYIILICPTHDRNKTYRGFAKNDKHFLVLMPDASNQAEIEELLNLCAVLFSGTNTLIILDDCTVSKDQKNRSSKFIENYPEHIYPTLPKDGGGETFRLQQTCDAFNHYETVRKKYKRYHDFLSKVSVSTGTLSFISSASGVGTALSGVGLPAGASLGAIGLICGILSVFTGAIAKMVSHKVNKHEQTVSICQSKVNSIKDRISKALNDNKISDEEVHNIISELDKYNEMKRDIRTSTIQKNIPNEADLKKQIRLEMMKKLQVVSINHLESK